MAEARFEDGANGGPAGQESAELKAREERLAAEREKLPPSRREPKRWRKKKP